MNNLVAENTKANSSVCSGNKTRTKDVEIDDPHVSFDDLQLAPEVIEGLKSASFFKPSPVQLKAIPLGKLGLGNAFLFNQKNLLEFFFLIKNLNSFFKILLYKENLVQVKHAFFPLFRWNKFS